MKLKKAALLSLFFLTIMATDTVAPLVGQISASFPEINPTLIKLTITLPSLLAIFFGLIAGQLVKFISKKVVLAIALGMYTIGGLAGGWSKSFTNHLLLRALLGAGTGMISPVATSLITDFFKGKERADMVGYSFAVSHFGGVVTPPLAAYIGAQDWHNAFFIYALAPLILIFTMVFIPENQKISGGQEKKNQAPIPTAVYWLSFASFWLLIIFFIIITDIPFLIETKPMLAPFITTFGLAISTFGSTISGLAFSWAYAKLKKWIVPIGLLITAIGFLMITFAQSNAIALTGLLFTGLGLGFNLAIILLLAANAVGQNDSTAALAFVNGAFSVGMFVSPFFYAVIPRWINPQADIIFNFQFASLFFLAAGILSIVVVHFLVKDKASVKTSRIPIS